MMLAWISTIAAGVISLLISLTFFFPYLWDDVSFYRKRKRLQKETINSVKKGIISLLDHFLIQAKTIPNKPFIIFEGDVYTYGGVDRRSNKMAQVFLKHAGLKKGDTVAMMMNNEPDFICVWFGLAKLGCAVAFLNANIRSKSFLHCFNTCGAKMLVVGADIAASLEDIYPALSDKKVPVWIVDKCSAFQGVQTLVDKLEDASDDPIPPQFYTASNILNTCLYLFTSGTTGFPKAALVTHLKIIKAMGTLRLVGATSGDIVYVTTPLYHMTASLLGVGGAIALGTAFVLKKKFSASQFWSDCKKNNITVFLYVGEICRYLCNQPRREEERGHSLRMAVGTGIRPEVWKTFIERFQPVKVIEMYGSTEGNISFINYKSKIGAVGHDSYFYRLLSPFELLQYDMQNQEPIRDKNGWCVKAKKGEPGLLVAPNSKLNPFFGYAGNKDMSENKLLRDVFMKGDVYFSTGDLMVIDQEDFIYFNDRVGDTFRWKGENVATTEVSDIISMLDYVQEANVYGVTVPGYEGKVGMAALILKPSHELDKKGIYKHVVTYLPAYARPHFLRIQDAISVTSTYKYQKTEMVKEGFNPAVISNPLYILDNHEESYVPLTQSLYNSILSCQIKL